MTSTVISILSTEKGISEHPDKITRYTLLHILKNQVSQRILHRTIKILYILDSKTQKTNNARFYCMP